MLLRPDHLDRPRPDRLAPTHPRHAEIMDRHRRALAAGEQVYRDPTTGYAVFTAAFLAARGYCCTSGCRHCPYADIPGA